MRCSKGGHGGTLREAEPGSRSSGFSEVLLLYAARGDARPCPGSPACLPVQFPAACGS
jgi:hypothetical protein